MLGVVPGVGLVCDEVRDRRREKWKVEIDRHSGLEATEVVVESPQGLLVTNSNSTDSPSGRPKVVAVRWRRSSVSDATTALTLSGGIACPSRHAMESLGERTAAGYDLVEILVHGGDGCLVHSPRSHAVARLNFVGVRDRLAGKDAAAS